MDIKKRLSDISELQEIHERQSKISELLAKLDPKISDVYQGGISALKQDHVEKLSQSANSLREVIYMISRLEEIKELGRVKTRSEGKTRKQDLIKNLDPVHVAPEEAYVLYDELIDDKLKWFSIVAHHSEFPNEDKFRKNVIEFDILLEKILKPHFDVIDEINKLLSIDNPTKKDFITLKHLISRNSSAYGHFFQNASTKWLPYLLKNKYIKNPSHITEINGERRFSLSPTVTYLWRSASKKPDEVSKIILGFKIPKKNDERNPWLLDYFVKAAIAMPSKYGKIIAQKIYKEKWIETSYHNYLSKPIAELMKKLADSGIECETVLLARTLLNIKLSEPYVTGGILDDYKTVRDVRPVIDAYWYGELLKNEIDYVFNKFPKAITILLIELITKLLYLENVGRGNPKSITDSSTGWRPAIEESSQNWDQDFRSELLGKLGNFLIILGQKSVPLLKQILKKVSESEYPTFRRFELYVYRMFPNYFKNEINYSVENYFDNYELHHEYYHLLKNAYSYTSTKTRKKYLSYVDRGPDKQHLELWEQQSVNQPAGYVERRIKFWKSDKLNPILEHLEETERKKFKDVIDTEMGLSHRDFHTYTEGPKTSEPKSELLDNLSVDQVFGFLKDYKTKELDFGYHDGTPEKFQNYVKDNSEIYSKYALKCLDLAPTFLTRFFYGINNAIKEKKGINWESILSLSEQIIEDIKQGKQKGNATLSSLIDVIEDGIGLDSIDFSFRNRVWNILHDLVIIQDGDIQDRDIHENYPRDDWDAYSISINNDDGKTFHAVMKYVRWCETHLKKKRIFVDEARNMLSDYLDQKLSSTISRQAVLGYRLPLLYYYDKEWIRNKLSNLFSNQNETLSRAAWDGYLLANVYSDIFEDLIPQYEIHVKKLNSPPMKDGGLWKFDERVIQHISLAYLYKFTNSEKLFNEMLNHSHERVLSHCAWWVGRILKEQKEKPSKSFDSEAFRRLWKNSSLTSNEELRSWIEYTPFNKKETLSLLYNSLKKSPKSIKFLSFLVEELESYAITHPQSTFKCLDLLIRKRADDLEFHIAREPLKNILKILLQSNKTRKNTIVLVHYLGELGFNEYKDLLDKK